jgi:hypothetical protein
MTDAFVIMQIGNRELEGVYEKAIASAIQACGLIPKRVDKHNKGGLLKSEIIKFIQESEIVVADLTNERPNCYLEIGYTMGWCRARNLQSKLILTCREDHSPDSPNRRSNGPKVHFDLSGYDISFWFPDRLESFHADLVSRIKRRRRSLASNSRTDRTIPDENWITKHRQKAIKTLHSLGKKSFIEAEVVPFQNERVWSLDELRAASVPIASSSFTGGGTTEKRFAQELVVENVGEQKEWCAYWTFRKSGSFYTLASLPEETRSIEGALSAQRRVIQMAWLLVCCQWFYHGLGLPLDLVLDVRVRHGGLLNRTLKAARYRAEKSYGPSAEDTISSVASGKPLADIVDRPEMALKELLEPLFELFGFPIPEDAYLKSFVGGILTGRIPLWSPD